MTLRLPPHIVSPEAVRAALLGLFGAEQALDIVEFDPLASPSAKLLQYTREPA